METTATDRARELGAEHGRAAVEEFAARHGGEWPNWQRAWVSGSEFHARWLPEPDLSPALVWMVGAATDSIYPINPDYPIEGHDVPVAVVNAYCAAFRAARDSVIAEATRSTPWKRATELGREHGRAAAEAWLDRNARTDLDRIEIRRGLDGVRGSKFIELPKPDLMPDDPSCWEGTCICCSQILCGDKRPFCEYHLAQYESAFRTARDETIREALR